MMKAHEIRAKLNAYSDADTRRRMAEFSDDFETVKRERNEAEREMKAILEEFVDAICPDEFDRAVEREVMS